MPSLLKALRSPLRALRYLFFDRSYERYYSPEIWDGEYRAGQADFDNPAEDPRYGTILQILRRYDDGHGALLDMGCGDGLLWARYRRLSDSILTGVDYSAEAIGQARARRLPNCRFQVGDYRTWQPERLYSIVVFNESLCYTDDFSGLMRRAGDWLERDGVIVVSMFDRAVTGRIWIRLESERPALQTCQVNGWERGGRRRSWTIRVYSGHRAAES